MFKKLAEKWPSSMVARTEIERFTGGIIKEKYLANLDCQGKGPEGRIRIGRKIAYPVDAVISFLEHRMEPVKARKQRAEYES
jgi:hypothetical protein